MKFLLISPIKVLEKVQKKATKIILEIRHLPYRERVMACKLPTLHYRLSQMRYDRNVQDSHSHW